MATGTHEEEKKGKKINRVERKVTKELASQTEGRLSI